MEIKSQFYRKTWSYTNYHGSNPSIIRPSKKSINHKTSCSCFYNLQTRGNMHCHLLCTLEHFYHERGVFSNMKRFLFPKISFWCLEHISQILQHIRTYHHFFKGTFLHQGTILSQREHAHDHGRILSSWGNYLTRSTMWSSLHTPTHDVSLSSRSWNNLQDDINSNLKYLRIT